MYRFLVYPTFFAKEKYIALLFVYLLHNILLPKLPLKYFTYPFSTIAIIPPYPYRHVGASSWMKISIYSPSASALYQSRNPDCTAGSGITIFASLLKFAMHGAIELSILKAILEFFWIWMLSFISCGLFMKEYWNSYR